MGNFFDEIENSYSAPKQPGSSATTKTGRRRQKRSHSYRHVQWIIALGALSTLGTIAGVICYQSAKNNLPKLLVANIPPQSLHEGQRLNLQIAGIVRPDFSSNAKFELLEGPSGAKLDPATGLFDWSPAEEHGPGQHPVIVNVVTTSGAAKSDFSIEVLETNRPPVFEKLADITVTVGEAIEQQIQATDPDEPKTTLTHSLEKAPPESTLDAATGYFRWLPPAASAGQIVVVTIRATEDEPNGLSTVRQFRVRVEPKVEVAMRTETPAASPDPSPPPPVPASSSPDNSRDYLQTETRDPKLQELLDLYAKKQVKSTDRKLFAPASYPILRAWFADRIRTEQADKLEQAWKTDKDAMLKWLDERPDFRDELFTALDPDSDNIVDAMKLLRELKETFPKDIDRYGNLAIATCVVWDQPKNVYHYKGVANRAKAKMPDNLATGVDSFRYLVEREQFMEGRILYVPWEYLTLIVNHETPVEERDWAMQAYGPRRTMFGKCYHDCPYDGLMLKSESEYGRLNGKDYNFVTLKQFGGVCVHQADYASRIGKSIGVPAASCAGSGRFGGAGHAWVMWVELKTITPTGIGFSIESHGRYRDDNYYVGHLSDPQTGRGMTDRDLERRLHAVGANTLGRRQAALVMRAWSQIDKALKPDFNEKLAYFSQTMKLSPWNEDAWREVARLARENSEKLTANDRKQLQKGFMTLFTVFAGLPDFTVDVFADLLAFETNPKKRIEYYNQLLDLYANAKRPDLSFKKLPELVRLLTKDERKTDAVNMLAAVIKKNANEGKYIPPVLDDLEELCAGDEKLTANLVSFYVEVLPLIDTKRGGSVSDYCVSMHKRAIKRMEAAGQAEAATVVRHRLAVVEASGTSK